MLHVVTHPQAVHHVEGRVGGSFDFDLTPAGVKAAGQIGETLRAAIPEDDLVDIYTSDRKRCKRTADAIGERFGIEPIIDQRLREKYFGEAEGHSKARWNELFRPPPRDGDRMAHRTIPNGESDAELAERIYAAMESITQSPCDHQIIVTHGFALTFVVAAWIKMPIGSLGYVVFKAHPGSITTLVEDDVYRSRVVVRLAETGHLR